MSKSPTARESGGTLQVRKQKLVRDAIWDAAITLFSERGYEETTVDAIAEAAGVSRRSFFRYFSSKSELMAHRIESYGDELSAAIEGFPASYSLGRVFRETVRQIARQSALQSVEARARTRKIMQIALQYPDARQAQLARMAEVERRVGDALQRRSRRGSREDQLTAGVAGAMTLSVLNVMFRFWFEQDQEDVAVTAEQVLAALERVVCEAAGKK